MNNEGAGKDDFEVLPGLKLGSFSVVSIVLLGMVMYTFNPCS